MAYRIRAVRTEDWQKLRELRLAALADPVSPVAFNETYDDAAAQDDDFWRRRAARGLQGMLAETFVAEDEADGGHWAGSATALDEGDSVQVVGVYLRPQHRGTGLAESIFGAVEAWALERPYATYLLLHVHEHNPRAEAFYRRLGYVHTGKFVMDPKGTGLREFEMVRGLRRDPGGEQPGARRGGEEAAGHFNR